MALIIATDEAGYGPNLGPLVVSATAWNVDDSLFPSLDDDLFESTLSGLFCTKPTKKDDLIYVADSKSLFASGNSLRKLERAVFTLLSYSIESSRHDFDNSSEISPTIPKLKTPKTLLALLKMLGRSKTCSAQSNPWWDNTKLPVDLGQDESRMLLEKATRFFGDCQIQFRDVVSKTLHPLEFNRECEALGNKANLLSKTTLDLVKVLMDETDQAEILVRCDKHGGRSKYSEVIQNCLTDQWIHVVQERPDVSVYKFSTSDRRQQVRMEFRAKGERYLPVATSSVFAKYLREVCMKNFNQFWMNRISGLKPTAGYPVDAKRFRAEIATEQKVLGIEDAVLWRNR